MRVSILQLRKIIREQLGIEFYFSQATRSLKNDCYFGPLVESACSGTTCLFGSIIRDHVSAELEVAKILSELHTSGPLVFAYGSRSNKVPDGFSHVTGVPGLFMPTARLSEIHKLTRQGVRDINSLIQHHKPDVIIWDMGIITEVEVKHTKRRTFTRIPSASRTDYDYYVLIAENKTFFINGDHYRAIAKMRSRICGKDIDFTRMKRAAKDQEWLYARVRESIDSLGKDELSDTLVNAIMHRLIPQGKKNQMTLPFSVDGHKVRLDLKLENKKIK